MADVRWASQNARPGRSSIGSKPSEANGFELSPVDKYRLPSLPNASEPEECQHSVRWFCIWKMTFCEFMSRRSPLSVKRAMRVSVEESGSGV